jgi:predicted metal-binding membrane protein
MSLWTVRARSAQDRYAFLAVFGILVGAAWMALALWGHSPHGRLLQHDALAGDAPAGGLPLSLVFVAGWLLMTVAMMLPTSLPLVTLFRALTRQRPDRHRLLLLLIAGYLGAWVLFGGAVHLADLGLHVAVDRTGWLGENAWLIGGATVLVAGVYQFTPLKYHCLDKCRSPRSFLLQHWRGRNASIQAVRLGAHHGLFCIGCCWTLMLLMFGVGVGSLGWMLALAAAMAVEKNLPWGRRISAPLGLTLIVGGVGLLIYGGATRS